MKLTYSSNTTTASAVSALCAAILNQGLETTSDTVRFVTGSLGLTSWAIAFGLINRLLPYQVVWLCQPLYTLAEESVLVEIPAVL